MEQVTVDIRNPDGTGFVGNVFSVTRMEESDWCYFFFSDQRMVAGFNKSAISHNFRGPSFVTPSGVPAAEPMSAIEVEADEPF